MARLSEGFDIQKFFPAEINGGAPALKAFSGPLSQIRFMPTGGVTPENLDNYLSLDRVVAAGGSWLASAQDIADGNWPAITRRAREASDRVAAIRAR